MAPTQSSDLLEQARSLEVDLGLDVDLDDLLESSARAARIE